MVLKKVNTYLIVKVSKVKIYFRDFFKATSFFFLDFVIRVTAKAVAGRVTEDELVVVTVAALTTSTFSFVARACTLKMTI